MAHAGYRNPEDRVRYSGGILELVNVVVNLEGMRMVSSFAGNEARS